MYIVALMGLMIITNFLFLIIVFCYKCTRWTHANFPLVNAMFLLVHKTNQPDKKIFKARKIGSTLVCYLLCIKEDIKLLHYSQVHTFNITDIMSSISTCRHVTRSVQIYCRDYIATSHCSYSILMCA